MKRNLLLTLAFAASSMAFAQTNLALDGKAIATASRAENPESGAVDGCPNAAIDDNMGTRWEAQQSAFSESEDVSWTLDLGSTQTFNTIQIAWEGAYSKSFKLEYSTTGEDGDWKEFTTVTETTLEGFPNVQSYNNADASDVDAQYIRFTNMARGTEWGVSFYEFRVFKMEAAVLTSIDLKVGQTTASAGTAVDLIATGKNQISQDMEIGDMTYIVKKDGVETTEGFTIADGKFTATVPGVYTIAAKAGDIKSNEVTISVYAGEKIDLFTKMQSMVTPIGEETTTGSMVGAFDDNMGSVWELHAGTDGDDAARTYDTGFVVDLQALYDITAISATFEGACPEDYTISFAGNDGVYGNAHFVTGHPGMAKFTDFFLTEDTKEIRYIKFLSTKAATSYGVKIFDFSVYGDNKQDMPDTAAPTEFTASVVEGSETFASVSLNLKATDDVSSVITYVISYDEGTEHKMVTASGASGTETIYTVSGLKENTDYEFSVVAKDVKDNATEAVTVNAKTTALESAPAPTQDAANVMSIYSDTYGNADALNTNPDWGQPTVHTPIMIGEDNAIMLSGLTYQGMEFTLMDVTPMDYLHVDVYPLSSTSVTITPIWRNTETNGNYNEIPYDATELVAGQWNQLDIPMSAFASDDRKGTNNLYQIKLDNGKGNTFIFDNFYLYKNTVADEEAPVWVSAEATTVADTKATITVNATDNNVDGMLTYTVKNGDDVMATKTAKQGEDATIEITGLTPETLYSLTVSVKDAANNEAEDKLVSFTTTEKIQQPMSGNGTITVKNDVITEEQTLRYSWKIVQDKDRVTITFVCESENSEVTGLDGESGNLVCKKNADAEANEEGVLTFTWENVNVGDVLTARAWWAVAGGRAETPNVSFTVEDSTVVNGINNINTGKEGKDAIYNLNGQRVINARHGIFIINGKKIVNK